MKMRPPYNRNRSRRLTAGPQPAHKPKNPDNYKGSRLKVSSRRAGFILLAVLLYSGFEYTMKGTVEWPYKLFRESADSVGDYATRPDAAWRRASDAVGSLGAIREGQKPSSFDLVGRVVRVSDGDTVSVLDSNNQQHKIRFFGIDCPERDQPHGMAAQRALADLVENRNVGVVVVDTDDYGRTVGTIYLDDTNINLAMVAGGHAWWYRYHAPHERHLEAAERDARAAQRGLWSAPQPVAPWDWRRGRR